MFTKAIPNGSLAWSAVPRKGDQLALVATMLDFTATVSAILTFAKNEHPTR